MKSSATVRHDAGFTLIEVLVSLFIFLLVSAGMATAFVGQLRMNTFAEVRSNAISAAQHVLDELRISDPAALPMSGSSDPVAVSVGERSFEVVTYFCRAAAFCSAQQRHLVVEVFYRGEKQYDVETVFTRLR